MHDMNIVLDLFAIIIDVIMLGISYLDINITKKDLKNLRRVMWLNIAVLCVNVLSSCVIVSEDYVWFNMILLVAIIILANIAGWGITVYISSLIDTKNRVIIKRIATVNLCLSIFVTIGLAPTSLLYTLDNGVYVKGVLFFVPYNFMSMFAIIDLFMVICFRRIMDKEDIYAICGYLIVSSFGGFAQIFMKGVLAIYPMQAIAYVTLFGFYFLKSSKQSTKKELQLEFQKNLLRCSSILREQSDIEKAVSEILYNVANYYGANRTYMMFIDKSNDYKRNVYSWCEDEFEEEIDMLKGLSKDSEKKWLSLIDEKGILHLNKKKAYAEKNEVMFDIFNSFEADDMLMVSILVKGKTTGFISVQEPTMNTTMPMLLQTVSSMVLNELQQRSYKEMLYNLSFNDQMTGLHNRHAYMAKEKELNEEMAKNVGVIFADINGLKTVNDVYGHEKGDELIKNGANTLRAQFNRDSDSIYRIGGDEFVVICENITEKEFKNVMEKTIKALGDIPLMSMGEVWISDVVKLETQLKMADEMMYRRKKEYYERTGIERRRSVVPKK